MQRIHSASNPRLKAASKLKRSRGRRQQDRLIVYGRAEVDRAMQSDLPIVELFVCSEHLPADQLNSLVAKAEARGIDVLDLSPDLYKVLRYGDRQDGVMAVARRPITELDQLKLGTEPLIGIVQSVEKPGNLGAVIRSADGAGIDALIVTDPLCDPFHPNCIRASLATVFSVPIACCGSRELLAWLREREIRIYATRVDAEQLYYQADLTGGVAIAMGNEAAGLSAEWGEPQVVPIAIPMRGLADSLNLSASAAIMFYEASRQRHLMKTSLGENVT